MQSLVNELDVNIWMLRLVLGDLRVERWGRRVNHRVRFVETKFTGDVWQQVPVSKMIEVIVCDHKVIV